MQWKNATNISSLKEKVMTFYYIVWITVFILGGVALGILGLAHLEYFTILLINPRMVDELLEKTENYYSRLILYKMKYGIVFNH
jgi:hypothetical protein